jgi:hypothetical protein
MAPLVGLMFLKCIPKRSKLDWFVNNRFTKCLIFLFKIPKDDKDFFHGCRHDYERHEICHQQEVGNPQP